MTPKREGKASTGMRARFKNFVNKSGSNNNNNTQQPVQQQPVPQPQPQQQSRRDKTKLLTPDTPEDANFDSAGFWTLLDRFIHGTDTYCNKRFKLVPRVVDGNWIVKKSVGTKPAIMGNKLYQKIHRNVNNASANYVEVDIDVHSSQVGAKLLALCKGWSDALVIDLMFLIEGQTAEELPERMIGGVRIVKPNLDNSARYPTSTIQQCKAED
jgi:hypothetical protein